MNQDFSKDAVRAGIEVLCKRMNHSDLFLTETDRFTVHSAMYDIVVGILAAAQPHLTARDRAPVAATAERRMLSPAQHENRRYERANRKLH